jgi:hypothetical protein
MTSVPERPEDDAIFNSIVRWQTNHHNGGGMIGFDADGNAHHFAFRRDIPAAEREALWVGLERDYPEEAQRLQDAMARLLLSGARHFADQLTAEGFTAEHVRTNPPRADEAREAYLIRLRATVESAQAAPLPKPKRTRRPSPSKLAKWEAAWQAEQAAEGER